MSATKIYHHVIATMDEEQLKRTYGLGHLTMQNRRDGRHRLAWNDFFGMRPVAFPYGDEWRTPHMLAKAVGLR